MQVGNGGQQPRQPKRKYRNNTKVQGVDQLTIKNQTINRKTMNIDQLKLDLCRQIAIIELIERSQQRAMWIVTTNSHYYKVFSNDMQMQIDLMNQNKVTQRLVNYLTKLTQK